MNFILKKLGVGILWPFFLSPCCMPEAWPSLQGGMTDWIEQSILFTMIQAMTTFDKKVCLITL